MWISGGAAAAAAHQQMIAMATAAMGPICEVTERGFLSVIGRTPEPIVVCSVGGFFSREYRYLTNYKGMFFFTRSPQPIPLPAETEVVEAKKLMIPGLM